MDEAEFDQFADEYRQLHSRNIRASGEDPEYFAEYKIANVAREVATDQRLKPLNILDFGAGIGESVSYFRKYLPAARLTCLDVSKKSLSIGAERFPGQADFVHFDGITIPASNETFDLAYIACVLHHIPHRKHLRLLREIHRVLKPGGSLIIFEHNPFNPLTVHAVNTCPFDEHAVLLRPAGLRASVRAAGFGALEIKFRIFFPHALRALRSLERHLYWLPFGAQYYLRACR